MESKKVLSRRSVLKSGLALGISALASRLVEAASSALAGPEGTQKRVYIALDDHTDYLWMADEATYQQAFLEMLDNCLDRADETASELSAYQSRWNCDGSFWVWTYEKNRSASAFNRLISRIRDGHVSMPLNALVVAWGGVPAEAVLRGMYYAGKLERQYDLRFSLAYAVENTTVPYGVASLWAGAGARYTWRGVCGCASKIPNSSLTNRDLELYWWEGPDGSRVLTKWYSLVANPGIGSYAEARDLSAAIDAVETNVKLKAYTVVGLFGKGWDDLKTSKSDMAAFATTAKAKTNANRQVIVSNEVDFFQDLEATYGASLPSLSCSFGNEWDVLIASMAEVSARVKRAVEKLRAAEALAALVSIKAQDFMNGRTAARDLAWMDLGLYWDHDWTADSNLRNARRDWQKRLAGEIESYVNVLHADAASALARLIRKSGTTPRFYAFNPLSWERTDIADLPYSGAMPVHVIDLSTGSQVPSQVVTVDGQQYLRILASAVPPVGYKVYEIRAGQGDTFSNAATVNAATGVIENDLYKLTVASRGAITSLLDKTRSNREFASVLNDLESGSGTLTVENVGPVSATLVATVSTSSPLKHTSRITLLRGLDRIAIRNDITQNFSSTNSWRFSFNLTSPDLWHEEVGAVILAKLMSEGGHYAPKNARYDWLTLNHFADMSGGGVGVTLSNADCQFMQRGSSSDSRLDTTTPQISVLAGGQVDGTALGIPNQGGDTHFMQRFALRTHGAFDPVAAMKFALEHQNLLVTQEITGGDGYPEYLYSLVSLSSSNVLLWALKPAEDGIQSTGLAVRLWNLSNSQADFTLALPAGTITSAQNATHIETPTSNAVVSNGALQASLAKNQMGTFLVRPVMVNHAPVAQDQAVTVPHDNATAITLIATDVDYDTLTYSIVAQPAHGTLSGTGANRTYTPNAGFLGLDSFTFRVNDGTVDSNVATVSINVVNHAPAAQDRTVGVPKDIAVDITLVATDIDSDTLTYTIVEQPTQGALSGSGASRVYTPNADAFGMDSFTFKANDGKVDSNVARVSLIILDKYVYLPLILKE